MSADALLTQIDERGIARLTINRPEVRNALDTAMQRRLVEMLHDVARDPSVRVVVLAGAGKAFSAGADVRTMGAPDPGDALAQKWGADPTWLDLEARVDRLRQLTRASVLLHTMGKPTIAMVRGAAAGMGLSFALACDFRIAARGASFVTAFSRIGMSGDFGCAYFLTKLMGPTRAKQALMLGDRIDAEEAERLGLLTQLVEDAELEAATQAFAARLAAGPPIALRYVKENVHAALDETLENALEVESRNMIRTRLTQDAKEAMAAFLEKREPKFSGR